MIDIIDKILDRLLQLYKYKKDKKKIFFENEIVPLHNAFEELHQDYIDSFRTYQNDVSLNFSEESLVKLINKIRQDHFLTKGIRSKVKLLSKHLYNSDQNSFTGYFGRSQVGFSFERPMPSKKSKNYFEELLKYYSIELVNYFTLPEDHYFNDGGIRLIDNAPRTSLIRGIDFIMNMDNADFEKVRKEFENEHNKSTLMIDDRALEEEVKDSGKANLPSDFIDFPVGEYKIAVWFPELLFEKTRKEILKTNELKIVKLKLIISLLDNIINYIQQRYERVNEGYIVLRKEVVN